MRRPEPHKLAIRTQGAATIPSPVGLSTVADDGIADYVSDGARVLCDVELTDSVFRRILIM